MHLCSENHIEICWEEGRYCPLCEAKEEIKTLEKKNEELLAQ